MDILANFCSSIILPMIWKIMFRICWSQDQLVLGLKRYQTSGNLKKCLEFCQFELLHKIINWVFFIIKSLNQPPPQPPLPPPLTHNFKNHLSFKTSIIKQINLSSPTHPSTSGVETSTSRIFTTSLPSSSTSTSRVMVALAVHFQVNFWAQVGIASFCSYCSQ